MPVQNVLLSFALSAAADLQLSNIIYSSFNVVSLPAISPFDGSLHALDLNYVLSMCRWTPMEINCCSPTLRVVRV